MNPILKNVLAVVAGVIVGGLVNMGLIMILGGIIQAPEGVDPSNMESIKANMHLYKPIHFISPFLSHAIGTLAGAYTAARIAANNKLRMSLIIGVFFLIGGYMMIKELPSPGWFNALDLIFAYIPMAWLGAKMASK